ncbi:NB-ARC domain-containing protein [Actinokineospora sp. PR83]|uniref:AfsR/SARP family transcriptional regulator n=1 Tax=Actinokineospora sp. PR83 TaxID=2884908 RepID=UPI001F21D792|nr:AfsR/SARP family transcriptional regulator [Actinokineospora sp. PR83]MCG8917258.1 NB-ARC domain-containing protein [Actinokineospora sp. PR83]
MFFQILGSLEAAYGGAAINVGRNRQRIVLALLLSAPGRTVTIPEFVEALWGGRPPKTAAEQVQTCVWRLRRSFSVAGAPDLIETTAAGYTLRVDPQAVDSHRFTTGVDEARALAASGDRSMAAKRFRCALALFRGPVLAEVDSPVVQAMAAQWEERRLAVLEECLALEMECGRSRELIDELTALVEQHPLREGLRAKLMHALYSADRRAEALDVYARGRARLIDELGLEPGRALREMQQRILAGEPAAAAVEPQVRATPVPAQLVSTVPDFVDRPEHADLIRAALTERRRVAPRVCGVHGNFGAGKSALAVNVAHQVRGEFPDGQLYADLRGSRSDTVPVPEVLARFLRALGVSDSAMPADQAERSGLFRSLIDGKRILVLLDDVPTSDWVCPVMPAHPEAALLMTSRCHLSDVPGAVPVEVGVLTVEQSVRLLCNVVGEDRVTAEPDAAHRLVNATGRLPLSVRAAAARLAARPHLGVEHLAQRLSDPYRRLDELSHGTLDMRSYLEPSADALSEQARRVWISLGLLQVPDFGAWVVAAATNTPIPIVESVLEHLVDRGLLHAAGEDHMGVMRYRMHRLGGLYARERALRELTAAERAELLDRSADCWLGLAQRAEQLLSGVPEDSELLECPNGACQLMIDMVKSDPGGWLLLEAEGLRFAARHRDRAAGVRVPAAGLDRWDFSTDVTELTPPRVR